MNCEKSSCVLFINANISGNFNQATIDEMNKRIYILFIAALGLIYCRSNENDRTIKSQPTVDSLVMFLSAFGVESDGFPSIDATIDFKHNSSVCKVYYDNPKFKNSTYSMTLQEIKEILSLFQNVRLDTLKKEYTHGPTDQPTSTTTIYTSTGNFIISDYGLQAEYPLNELYKIVYKLNENFR